MCELALSFGLVVQPLAFVFGSIGPNLYAKALPDVSPPLTVVNNSIFKLDRLSSFYGITCRWGFSLGLGFHLYVGVKIFFIFFGEAGTATLDMKFTKECFPFAFGFILWAFRVRSLFFCWLSLRGFYRFHTSYP
jgi:hypothetical protein